MVMRELDVTWLLGIAWVFGPKLGGVGVWKLMKAWMRLVEEGGLEALVWSGYLGICVEKYW